MISANSKRTIIKNIQDDQVEIQNKQFKSNESTPVSRKSRMIEDERLSPICIRFTQDGHDDEGDVVWDWNSPQSKVNRTRALRRCTKLSSRSPESMKLVLPSKKKSAPPRFGNLKAELEELVSTLRDGESKTHNTRGRTCSEGGAVDDVEGPEQNEQDLSNLVQLCDTTNLFDDDSLDEQMIECTQKIEAKFNETSPRTSPPKTVKCMNNSFADDSFDVLFEKVCSDVTPVCMGERATSRTIVRTASEPCDFPEVQVRERETSQSPAMNRKQPASLRIAECSQDEIERKRMEAKAKLESRRKQQKGVQGLLPRNCSRPFTRTSSEPCDFGADTRTGGTSSTVCTWSGDETIQPDVASKCSPDEIEKKRQEAKAKRELRRRQDEIEQKRLQALETLKRNRLRREGHRAASAAPP